MSQSAFTDVGYEGREAAAARDKLRPTSAVPGSLLPIISDERITLTRNNANYFTKLQNDSNRRQYIRATLLQPHFTQNNRRGR
jgi:hypothetical protein